MLIVLLPLCPPTLFAFCLDFIIITFTLNDELVICSLNVRGLSNPLKRRETFRWLKMKKYGIFFLQDVHCTKEKESLWTSEWGFTAFFSNFSSASARVCILFNNNFQFEIIRQFSDQEGRIVIYYHRHESTGCPKSSFLYFISLYFSTIGLGKQIISTKVVSFNVVHYFHSCCAIF